MKGYVLAAAISVLCAPAAHATAFTFSDQFDLGLDLTTYQFGNGPLATGSFDATLTGVTFTNITNFKLFVNGVAVTTPGRFDRTILSSDGSADNFYVAYDTPTYVAHYSIGSYHDLETQFIQSYNYGVRKVTYTAVTDPVAGVPEPASWALMVLGFGATGYAMRRRQRVARFA